MPSFSVPGVEGFCLSAAELVSNVNRLPPEASERPVVIKAAAVALALAGTLLSSARASTFQFQEDFSTDPVPRWTLFGEASLFQWDSTAENLRVTWDSAQPKSLFHIPLPRTIGRYDNFSFEFDLLLEDIVSGHEEGKTGPMQIGIGFLNSAATNADWSRVDWPLSANVAEFNCYPSGHYPGWPVDATTAPAFVSANGFRYAPKWLDDYMIALPLQTTVRVRMSYTAEDQTLTAVWTTNGVPVSKVHTLVLSNPADSQFTDLDDFQVNIFSISSYKSNEGDYANSVLANGSVDNVRITIPPPPPVCRMQGGFDQGAWSVQFISRVGWTYTLERSPNLHKWTNVQENVAGNGALLILKDMNPPAGHSFYRVLAIEE